ELDGRLRGGERLLHALLVASELFGFALGLGFYCLDQLVAPARHDPRLLDSPRARGIGQNAADVQRGSSRTRTNAHVAPSPLRQESPAPHPTGSGYWLEPALPFSPFLGDRALKSSATASFGFISS